MLTSRHVLRFPSTLSGIDEAAGSLRQLLDARGLTEVPRYNVELAFEEIAGNIVRHGCPSGDVDVAIAFDEDEVLLTFEDDGVPFDPRKQPSPPVPASIDEAKVSGLGLVLVRKVSSRMDYVRTSRHHNHLTLVIPVR